MNRLRRVASMLMVLPLAFAGVVVSSGVASAAVVVPPGKSGSVCTDYHWITFDDSFDRGVYWQTCAWADHQYVWFTVNFGNTMYTHFFPDVVWVNYIKSGVKKDCWKAYWQYPDFVVNARSVQGTPRMSCVITRVPGAYAADAYVEYGQWEARQSPTLQVQ